MYTHSSTGPVRTIDWSSDGYVLAVGWEHGWAVWSVAGRCLAWGFGTEYAVDEDRCVCWDRMKERTGFYVSKVSRRVYVRDTGACGSF